MLGVALRLLGTVVVGRSIGRPLCEVPPNDPMTFAITTALFLMVATGATLVPAHRATRVSPAEALRGEWPLKRGQANFALPSQSGVQHRRHLLRPWHPDRPDHVHTPMNDAEPSGPDTRGHGR
jgi:hypothetical protein